MQSTTRPHSPPHDGIAPAPPWQVSRWFNTQQPLTLAGLRGRVVVLHTFQMLCPACVSHGLPQAAATRRLFDERDVAVVGLHTVFEHHAVMNAAALQAFIHEYRLEFPIGIDAAADADTVPLTMRSYGLRGTPSVLVFDRQGALRLSHFGRIDDMALGAVIGQLISATPDSIGEVPRSESGVTSASSSCTETACRI